MSKFTVVELGKPDGETLVFLGGWPDDALSGWSPIFNVLKNKYRIVSLCIPGFEAKCTQHKPWGYSFDELVTMLHDAIKESDCDHYTFIVHDWGSVLGLLYQKQFPDHIKSMIVVDVGIKDPTTPTSVWETFLILLYQWWSAFTYITTQFLGARVGQIMLLAFYGVLSILPFLKVCPHDSAHRPLEESMDPRLLHLYYRFWRDFFTGNPPKLTFPTCPMLYMV